VVGSVVRPASAEVGTDRLPTELLAKLATDTSRFVQLPEDLLAPLFRYRRPVSDIDSFGFYGILERSYYYHSQVLNP
jgi:hypothetical protein